MSSNYYKKSGKHAITTDILIDLLDDKGQIKNEYLPTGQVGRNSNVEDFSTLLDKIASHIEALRYHYTKESMMNYICETVLDESFCPITTVSGDRITVATEESEVL